MQKLGVYLNPNKVPACKQYEDDEYWKCAIRQMTFNLGGVTGTVKMGTKPQEGACVDNKLRVYGVNKLRVVDASIIPITMSGHLTAPTVVIGEKASEILKQAWE